MIVSWWLHTSICESNTRWVQNKLTEQNHSLELYGRESVQKLRLTPDYRLQMVQICQCLYPHRAWNVTFIHNHINTVSIIGYYYLHRQSNYAVIFCYSFVNGFGKCYFRFRFVHGICCQISKVRKKCDCTYRGKRNSTGNEEVWLLLPHHSTEEEIADIWESLKYDFPNLYQIATVILGTGSSQVTVERLFSNVHLIVNLYRTRFSKKNWWCSDFEVKFQIHWYQQRFKVLTFFFVYLHKPSSQQPQLFSSWIRNKKSLTGVSLVENSPLVVFIVWWSQYCSNTKSNPEEKQLCFSSTAFFWSWFIYAVKTRIDLLYNVMLPCAGCSISYWLIF